MPRNDRLENIKKDIIRLAKIYGFEYRIIDLIEIDGYITFHIGVCQ